MSSLFPEYSFAQAVSMSTIEVFLVGVVVAVLYVCFFFIVFKPWLQKTAVQKQCIVFYRLVLLLCVISLLRYFGQPADYVTLSALFYSLYTHIIGVNE